MGENHEIHHADFNTVCRACAVFNGLDGPYGLWWRTDAEYAPLTLFVNCNDLFYWGSADCEEVHAGNVSDLERARDDLRAIGDLCEGFADILFAARLRKMRPQGPYYNSIPKETWALFDACGPERPESPRRHHQGSER